MLPPHLTWSSKLLTYLLECEAAYRAQKDDLERRRYATLVLAGVIQRVEALTTVDQAGGLSVFRDTLDFFDDLHRGRDHAWLSLGPFGGFQKYTKAEERARVHLLIGLEMLIDAASAKVGSKKAAFERMQRVMSAAGRPMTIGRVKTLYHEYKRGDFPHPELVRQFFEGFWLGQRTTGEIARCEHGDPVHHCRQSGGERCVAIVTAAHQYVGGLFIEPN